MDSHYHLSDGKVCGDLLRQLRRERNLSTRVAAKEIGVSVSSLIAWENGRFPTPPSLIVTLKFYGVTATIGVDPGQVKS